MRQYSLTRRQSHGVAMPFTGFASYDDMAVHDPDISEILLLTSPVQTPFLDALPQALKPATDVIHSWFEEQLGPDRLTLSAVLNSVAVGTSSQHQLASSTAFGHLLTVGSLLEVETPTGQGEIVQINSIVGPNTVSFVRGVARGVSSLTANGSLFYIGTAELEGGDTSGDVTRIRTRKDNYTQIFKKPILISGTRQSVVTMDGVVSEIDHQERNRLLELTRDLEKAVIRGVAINTIGADDVYRTMNGMRAMLTSVNSTMTNATFAGDPVGAINAIMQTCWNTGARDLDMVLVGDTWSNSISAANASRIQLEQQDAARVQLVERIQTDFGAVRKIMSPWMPRRGLMVLSSRRIFVPNMRGRNFKREELAKTGDSTKRHLIGEYTLELHREDQMGQLSSTD